MMNNYEQILEFWFGSGLSNLEVIEEKSGLWWKKDADTDAEIRQRFEALYQRLVNGELDEWRNQARSQLAMIILTDQFPRNMYRDTAEAFATDPLAINLSLNGLEEKKDQQLREVERVFFYMPLMHAESIELQDKAVLLFDQLVESAEEEDKKGFSSYLDYAIRHRQIIERFNRFPHRNPLLGRESTDEEIEFLKQPGSSF